MSEHGGPPTRLIDVYSLELVTFRTSAPDYAILSHTWGREEVTLQHWRTPGWTRMSGFAKILGACRQARSDGYRYLWVDTCCIDKSSSAELAKAINSMYNWYRKSEVCYAYLQDVNLQRRRSGYGYTREDYLELSIEQLREARWFTRGWTLQELLAPDQVIFFDREWTCIGPLEMWLDRVAEITGINQSALDGTRPLEAFSAAQKFCWASNRATQEVEDEAYCLLGLCRVSLHPIPGEGRRAFLRLQEEILKQGDDSIFVWDTPSTNRQSRLFASMPSDFAESGDVECDESRPVDSSMWMTTRGVTGTFSLLPHGNALNQWSSAVALLNCRQDGNSHKLLALRIQRDSKHKNGTMYSVHPRAAQWSQRSRSSRLVSIDERKLHQAEKFQITLARTPPAVAFPDVPNPQRFYNPRLAAERDTNISTEYRNYVEMKAGDRQLSRPLTHNEAQALYRLENHVRQCKDCTEGCEHTISKGVAYLCRTGKSLYQDVLGYVRMVGGRVYPRIPIDEAFLEIPRSYWVVRELLSLSDPSVYRLPP